MRKDYQCISRRTVEAFLESGDQVKAWKSSGSEYRSLYNTLHCWLANHEEFQDKVMVIARKPFVVLIRADAITDVSE